MHRYGAYVMTLVLVVSGTAGFAGAVTAQQAGGTAATDHEAGPATVTFENQTTGGTTVVVDSVTLPDGGFVTVHDGTVTEGGNATFSSVAGTSRYLPAGTHEDVRVTLEAPVTDDTTLVAMPHRDTDGDRIYEFVSTTGGADGPYTAADSIVLEAASVTASATVTASDQPTDGTTVVVDRVELAEGGFVTIHDGTVTEGETFDSVRGTSAYLAPGVHEDVRVTLDEPLNESQTVVPMAHLDTDGDRSYDFLTSEGEADGPYTDRGGDIVLTTASAVRSDTARATFEDQASGGHRVVLDSVFLPDGGFVTAHDGTLAEGETFDSVRGTSAYLGPGLHRDVEVVLDEPLNDSQSVVAMPHRDTDDDESYDFVSSEGGDDGPYTADGEIVTESADVTVAAAVTVENQSSDGNTVTVAVADLSEGGFVTVHDASLQAGATLESVRGTSAYLEAGLHRNVTVALDEPLRTTQPVIAMAHRDTDDDQSYDFLTSEGGDDGPYTADGDVVLDSARATVTAQTTFESQETEGEQVVVRSVTLHDGGFVTVHDATLLDGAVFESVRGTSAYLGPGTHENVTVSLDQPIRGDGTFVAMPHRDTDGDQNYDFVSSEGEDDGPYTAGGPVVVPAEVQFVGETPTENAGGSTADAGTATADGETGDDGMGESTPTSEPTSGSGPGFGLVVALLALVGAALLAVRRT